MLIGFLAFTLLTVRYRVPSPDPPRGPWPEGQWPPVTLVVAAWNEEQTIVSTLDRVAGLSYGGRLEVVLADNNSTDRTAELAEEAAERHGLDYRRVFEPVAGKHHALNTALESVTTPLVVTLDADTLLHRDALTYLIARVTSRTQDQHVCACAGALVQVVGVRRRKVTGLRAHDEAHCQRGARTHGHAAVHDQVIANAIGQDYLVAQGAIHLEAPGD